MLFAGRVLRECRAERSPEAVSLICTPLHTMTKDRRRLNCTLANKRPVRSLSLCCERASARLKPLLVCARDAAAGGESQARDGSINHPARSTPSPSGAILPSLSPPPNSLSPHAADAHEAKTKLDSHSAVTLLR